MDERVTQLWAAAKAESLGHGGIATVVEATGISKSRIRAGVRDLAELVLQRLKRRETNASGVLEAVGPN